MNRYTVVWWDGVQTVATRIRAVDQQAVGYHKLIEGEVCLVIDGWPNVTVHSEQAAEFQIGDDYR